ncbi:DgyrCDS13014 [Dimorphilus gyrociliatus]|uniref:DgyrCDS13014 n=1 Tax=Dimorphilus gyrociliatus TaxID=2664684 RepID=A0A7I8W9E5_9ANNE|nr:DgyrCDS13014 [Dimorphilus gyrociliatus]
MSYLSWYGGNKENNRPTSKSDNLTRNYGMFSERSRYTNSRYTRSFSEDRSLENGPRRLRAESVDIDSITREIEERTAARKLRRLSQERELAALRQTDLTTSTFSSSKSPATSTNRYSQERDVSVTKYSNHNSSLTRQIDRGNDKQINSLRNIVDLKDCIENSSSLSTTGDYSMSRWAEPPDFTPNDVQVLELRSGKKATAMTEFHQTERGMSEQEGNCHIDYAVSRTRNIQDKMSSMEDFVRRNRRMFPSDVELYQNIRYFELSEQELRAMGESPDSNIIGIKVREKILLPPGSEDSAYILKKVYGKKREEIDESVLKMRTKKQIAEDDEEESQKTLYKRIREEVERKHEKRETRRILGDEDYITNQATKYRRKADDYNHVHSFLTPKYIKSIYHDAGAEYDEIYQKKKKPREKHSIIKRSRSEEPEIHRVRRKQYTEVPSFTARLRPKRSIVRGIAKFSCSVLGYPFPKVKWFKGQKELKSDEKLRITNDFGLLTLEINNVQHSDAGIYAVKIWNSEGEKSCSAVLEVDDFNEEYEIPNSGTFPHFVKEANMVQKDVGNDFEISVQVTGNPLPSFKWLKDNTTIRESGKVQITNDDAGSCKLFVKNAQVSDSGLYSCLAFNSIGKTISSSSVTITDLSNKKRYVDEDSIDATMDKPTYSMDDRGPLIKGTKPWFLKVLPSKANVPLGDPIDLEVVIDGDPKPVAVWSKDGAREFTYTERHRMVAFGNHYILQIRSALETDAGYYAVTAENQYGKIAATCWINMLPRRIEGDDIEVQKYVFDHETPLNAEGKYPPKFIKKLPYEEEISSGKNINIECSVNNHVQKTTTTEEFQMTKSEQVSSEVIVENYESKLNDLSQQIVNNAFNDAQNLLNDSDNKEALLDKKVNENNENSTKEVAAESNEIAEDVNNEKILDKSSNENNTDMNEKTAEIQTKPILEIKNKEQESVIINHIVDEDDLKSKCAEEREDSDSKIVETKLQAEEETRVEEKITVENKEKEIKDFVDVLEKNAEKDQVDSDQKEEIQQNETVEEEIVCSEMIKVDSVDIKVEVEEDNSPDVFTNEKGNKDEKSEIDSSEISSSAASQTSNTEATTSEADESTDSKSTVSEKESVVSNTSESKTSVTESSESSNTKSSSSAPAKTSSSYSESSKSETSTARSSTSEVSESVTSSSSPTSRSETPVSDVSSSIVSESDKSVEVKSQVVKSIEIKEDLESQTTISETKNADDISRENQTETVTKAIVVEEEKKEEEIDGKIFVTQSKTEQMETTETSVTIKTIVQESKKEVVREKDSGTNDNILSKSESISTSDSFESTDSSRRSSTNESESRKNDTESESSEESSETSSEESSEDEEDDNVGQEEKKEDQKEDNKKSTVEQVKEKIDDRKDKSDADEVNGEDDDSDDDDSDDDDDDDNESSSENTETESSEESD